MSLVGYSKSLKAELGVEASTRASQDTSLDGKITAEKARAEGAEASEKARAEGKEGELNNAIGAEKARAEGKEAEEKARAEGAEAGLSSRVSAIENWKTENIDELVEQEIDKAINNRVVESTFNTIKLALENKDSQLSSEIAGAITARVAKDEEHEETLAEHKDLVDRLVMFCDKLLATYHLQEGEVVYDKFDKFVLSAVSPPVVPPPVVPPPVVPPPAEYTSVMTSPTGSFVKDGITWEWMNLNVNGQTVYNGATISGSNQYWSIYGNCYLTYLPDPSTRWYLSNYLKLVDGADTEQLNLPVGSHEVILFPKYRAGQGTITSFPPEYSAKFTIIRTA